MKYKMQQLLSESVQASVRPHECHDLYYADPKNSKVQCFPAIVENRFVTSLPSLQFNSTSTVTFSPDGGISDIIVSAVLAAPSVPQGSTAAAGTGLGLTRGWLYQLVDRISVRYAGSSLYFFQGEQELIECLSECEDSVKRDQLLQLGGAEIASPTDWASENLRSASIYIKLPHNSPSAQEKPILFPTDVLSAPVQVQITFKPLSAVLLVNPITDQSSVAIVAASAPTQFASAQMQFKQAHLQDRSDSAAMTQNLSEKALSIPLKNFMQSQFVATLPGGSGAINLTGFRSGSVQGIFVWGIPTSRLSSVGAKQPFLYSPIKAATLSVNGLVYFTSQGYSSQLLDLVERKTATASSTTSLEWSNGNQTYVVAPASSSWLWIPFAQGTEVLRDDSVLSNGLGIANSVVNLSLDFATGVEMTVYASYLYNCTILASGGSCDYVF